MGQEEFNDFPILTTERLTLRQLSEIDVREVFRLRSDALVNKYLNREPCKTLEDALNFIAKIKNNCRHYWAIVAKGDEKIVGTICLIDRVEEQKSGEIGFELLTEQQGKGIMLEAAKKVVEYATQTLALNTIDAYTHPDNESSIKLLKALSFNPTDSGLDKNSKLMLFRLQVKNKKL